MHVPNFCSADFKYFKVKMLTLIVLFGEFIKNITYFPIFEDYVFILVYCIQYVFSNKNLDLSEVKADID